MKKLIWAALLAVGLAAGASAGENTWAKAGTVSGQVGAGYNSGYGLLLIDGGINAGVYQYKFAPQFSLDFGVAARGYVGSDGLGAAALATASYSWKQIGTKLEWVDALETYLGLGLWVIPTDGLAGFGGTAYHLDKNSAIYVEGSVSGYEVIGYRWTL